MNLDEYVMKAGEWDILFEKEENNTQFNHRFTFHKDTPVSDVKAFMLGSKILSARQIR